MQTLGSTASIEIRENIKKIGAFAVAPRDGATHLSVLCGLPGEARATITLPITERRSRARNVCFARHACQAF